MENEFKNLKAALDATDLSDMAIEYAIKEAQKDIASQSGTGKWISVEDRLPEPELVVIVACMDNDFWFRTTAAMDAEGHWYNTPRRELFNVRLWTPFPELPLTP